MALEDLDLEFEDEEEQEAKRKKHDPLQPAVALEFGLVEEQPKLRLMPDPDATQIYHQPQTPERPQTPPRPTQTQVASPASLAKVNPAVSHQVHQTSVSRQIPPMPQGTQTQESLEIQELKERVRLAEFNADVRVQVAEHKISFITEMLSDVKLMDHQINQLLLRIHSKHPDMKQEVLMIKKILADFTAKKRK